MAVGSFFAILGFSVAAFAVLDYVAFGMHVVGTNTWVLSYVREFQASLGDIDLMDDYQNARVMGPILSFVFALVCMYVLTNLLIAVMTGM